VIEVAIKFAAMTFDMKELEHRKLRKRPKDGAFAYLQSL
jgi:hypothetical protein